MRISDWSSDVCSSDLLDFRKGIGFSDRPGAPDRRGLSTRRGGDDECPKHEHQRGAKLPGGHSNATAIMFHDDRSEEHTSELQSLMRISYAVFCVKKNTKRQRHTYTTKQKPNN